MSVGDADDPFARWGLTPVINAAGTMTAIGASRVGEEVRIVVDQIAGAFVHMDDLQSRAGGVIARVTGAEAGCVTSSASAALTQCVAACLTGPDLARIERLPEVEGERRVLLPMGHMINYGAPVAQAIRLAGAEVIAVGTAAACETWHLRAALEAGAAAAVYVVSHHTVRENELPLDLFVKLCGAAGVPVIVDMASEYDLRSPHALGVAAAIHSGHKFLSGPTSGIVSGTSQMVTATYLQHRGIGRTMKAGKEAVAGAIAALEAWERRDHAAARAAEERRVEMWLGALAGVPDVTVGRHEDWTGSPITRVRLRFAASAPVTAWDLAERLAARRPSVVVRDDLVERGEIYLDPCNLTDEEAAHVADAISEEFAHLRAHGPRRSWSEVKAAHEAAIVSWKGQGDAT